MYQSSRKGPWRKCGSWRTETEELDHCRNVDPDGQRQRIWPLQRSISTCAKIVEVDHYRNVDRDKPRLRNWTTAEM
ncbi:hypothetical protein PoB_004408100 [Plakobranchus ocellatus]|uniref:Uncharacterized protein n=1 Tax=Plakobranchus ocellatus TaxID=259542 RepID=A0AAV4B2K0_9GAST|nr:hypothetical protein PoB_004408100 [Plakobranchus ocellatus]